MEEPLVSILVPVYNVENYVKECLDSLINQTLKTIEIIVVNDGSTDKSRSIVEDYCSLDSRIRLINQENRGLGAARNVLLSYAKGKYVIFIDSDDYIDLETVEVLYRRAERDQTEILIYNGKAFYDYGNEYIFEKKNYFRLLNEKDDGPVLSGLQIIERKRSIMNNAFKLYNRKFMISNDLFYPEGILGEDVEFFYHSMIIAQRVSYVNYIGYFRRYRADSIMTSGSINNIKDRIDTFNRLVTILESVEQDKYRKIISGQLALYACGLWILLMGRKDKQERKILLVNFHDNQMDTFIRQNKKGVISMGILTLLSLPSCFNFINSIICILVRKIFRTKTRLFN